MYPCPHPSTSQQATLSFTHNVKHQQIYKAVLPVKENMQLLPFTSAVFNTLPPSLNDFSSCRPIMWSAWDWVKRQPPITKLVVESEAVLQVKKLMIYMAVLIQGWCPHCEILYVLVSCPDPILNRYVHKINSLLPVTLYIPVPRPLHRAVMEVDYAFWWDVIILLLSPYSWNDALALPIHTLISLTLMRR